MKKKPRREWDQWTTTCPKCKKGGTLIVAKVKHMESGRTYYPGTKLESDGFHFEPGPRWKGASTEDEEVKCIACDAVFSLGDLALRDT